MCQTSGLLDRAHFCLAATPRQHVAFYSKTCLPSPYTCKGAPGPQAFLLATNLGGFRVGDGTLPASSLPPSPSCSHSSLAAPIPSWPLASAALSGCAPALEAHPVLTLLGFRLILWLLLLHSTPRVCLVPSWTPWYCPSHFLPREDFEIREGGREVAHFLWVSANLHLVQIGPYVKNC